MWWGLFKKSFKESNPKLGLIRRRSGRSLQVRCPPIIHCRRGSRRSLDWQICVDKREGCRWRFESPNASNRSPLYKAKSEGLEMKRKVGSGRGGGGDSDPSDMVFKNGKKGKINWERERKKKRRWATQPKSDHLWSRSPSHGGEGRLRRPEHGGVR